MRKGGLREEFTVRSVAREFDCSHRPGQRFGKVALCHHCRCCCRFLCWHLLRRCLCPNCSTPVHPLSIAVIWSGHCTCATICIHPQARLMLSQCTLRSSSDVAKTAILNISKGTCRKADCTIQVDASVRRRHRTNIRSRGTQQQGYAWPCFAHCVCKSVTVSHKASMPQ